MTDKNNWNFTAFHSLDITAIPKSPGVYLISDGGEIVYVGMARSNLHSRLKSHQNGRRSGNQFAVYVQDFYVLPQCRDQIDEIAAGTVRLDLLVGEYVRSNFEVAWIALESGAEALGMERELINLHKPVLQVLARTCRAE